MTSIHSMLNNGLRLLIAGLFLFLTACGNDYAEQIQQTHTQVKLNLDNLEYKLSSKALTNAKLVEVYAKQLALIKPEFKPVTESLAKDATEQGALYKGLLQRWDKINRNPENKQQFQQANQSLISINSGADPIIFNDSLIDIINTMAELSGGQLETVSIPKNSNVAHVRGEKITPGSYLVGNPNYGSYQQDNSGRSFWHWYGQYAFFSSLFRGGLYNNYPIYYNRWNTRSHYSYYHDYGRSTYGTGHERRQTAQRNSRMRDNGLSPAKSKKQYGSAVGRQRASTYRQQRSKQANYHSKKYGSNNSGARHTDKTVAKRRSGFLGGNKTFRTNYSPSKRSASFFGSGSRSRRSFGGK